MEIGYLFRGLVLLLGSPIVMADDENRTSSVDVATATAVEATLLLTGTTSLSTEPSTSDPSTELQDLGTYTTNPATDVLLPPVLAILPNYRKLSFPVIEFFNVSEDVIDEYDVSSNAFYFDTFLSKVTCTGYHCDKTCSCDIDCFERRTCCIDYLWNQSNPLPLKDYLEQFVRASKLFQDLECRPVLQHTPYHNAQAIWMVASCPTGALDAIVELCLADGPSNDVNVPVIGSDGYVYRNQYCAICNVISGFEYLNITVTCEGARNVTNPGESFSNFLNCKFQALQVSAYPNAVKECENVYNRECDRKNPNYDLCRSYIGEADGRLGTYANTHCLRCNNESLDIRVPKYCTRPMISTRFIAYSFVISFTEGTQFSYEYRGHRLKHRNGTEPEYEGTKILCSAGEVFEIGSAKCVPFSCGFGYAPSGSTCVMLLPVPVTERLPVTTNSSHDNCLLRRGAHLSFDFIDRKSSIDGAERCAGFIDRFVNDTDLIVRSVGHDIAQPVIFYLRNFGSAEYSRFIANVSSADSELWTISGVRSVYLSSEKFYFTELYGLDFSRNFPGGICAESAAFDESNLRINAKCSLYDVARNSSLLFDDNSVAFVTRLTRGSVTKATLVCSKLHLASSCPLQTVPVSSITLLNDTLKIYVHNKTYMYSEYQPLSSGVGFCIDRGPAKVLYLPPWWETTNKVEYYLTMIGIPVSMICYVWIILTFTLIRALRNISGGNLVCLCLALLLSDAVFLTIIEVKQSASSCKAIAIIFHWLLLLVQAWSGIAAFDMARKFASAFPVSTSNSRRFTVYCVITLSLSSVLVGVMVCVDEAKGLVGYGKGGTCWIYYFNARLFGYIVVVATATAMSTALLGFALCKIYTQYRDLRDVLKDSKRTDVNVLKIALKLVLLVGIVEIVGLVQVTSPRTEWEYAINAAFRIMYTVFRSFRGVLIWLMYIANSAILKLYKATMEELSTSVIEARKVSGSNAIETSSTELHKMSTWSSPYMSRDK